MSQKSKYTSTAVLISCAVGIVVMLFGNNLCGTIKLSDKGTSVSNPKNQQENSLSWIIPKELIFKSYADKKVPILDKNIFIGSYSQDLIIGGVNRELLSLSVRNPSSEEVKIIRNTNKQYIRFSIEELPFIELEYKNKLFSIEVQKKKSNYYLFFKRISNPTMQLKEFEYF